MQVKDSVAENDLGWLFHSWPMLEVYFSVAQEVRNLDNVQARLLLGLHDLFQDLGGAAFATDIRVASSTGAFCQG